MATEQSGSGDIQRSLDLLWGLTDPPARGPKRGLTLQEIVRTAVAAADADGIEALSMRRVAADLGVGTMSLYRYVPGKAELLELMLDHVTCPDEAFIDRLRGADWRTVMEALARENWATHLKHRWLLHVNLARPLLGPNVLANFDFTMGELAGLGLTDRERVSIAVALDDYVTGRARTYVNGLEAAKRTGISDQEFWAVQEPMLVRALESGKYPVVAALDADTFGVSGEEFFEFGLARLMDGLAAFVEAAGTRENGSSSSPSSPTSSGDRDGRGGCA